MGMKKKQIWTVIFSLLWGGLTAQEAISVVLPENPSKEEVIRLQRKSVRRIGNWIISSGKCWVLYISG